jgi:hypothetical protein
LSYWRCPRDWAGERVFVLGGGPSLKTIDVASLRERGRVVAINDAFLLAPWADLLYWGDRQWFEWNHGELHRYAGPLKVTRATIPPGERRGVEFHSMLHARREILATDPCQLAGPDSGSNVLNLLLHKAAACAVLLGFEMRPCGHWHDRHQRASDRVAYASRYLPHHTQMAPRLAAAGLQVLNATPDSALDCYPKVSLDEVLR